MSTNTKNMLISIILLVLIVLAAIFLARGGFQPKAQTLSETQTHPQALALQANWSWGRLITATRQS